MMQMNRRLTRNYWWSLNRISRKMNETDKSQAKASGADRGAFWDSLLEKAEQRLTEQEYRELEPIINQLKKL
ncbi:hypothetical protein ACFTAO_46985 [Paenibacillus rhizoplanae]